MPRSTPSPWPTGSTGSTTSERWRRSAVSCGPAADWLSSRPSRTGVAPRGAHELGTLIQRLRPEHPYFDGPPWQEAVRTTGKWTAPREIRVTTSQSADPARIVAFVGSMSFVAALPEDRRAELLAQVTAIVEAG